MELSTWVRRVALGVGIGLIAAACGGDDDDGSSSASGAYLDVYCDFLDECCQQSGIENKKDSCVSTVRALQSGTYDAARGQACIDEINAARAAGTLCTNQSASTTDQGTIGLACGAVFTNTGATKNPGETCKDNRDCRRPDNAIKVDCNGTFSGGTTVVACLATVLAKEGEACGESVGGFRGECDRKAFLHCDSATHTCVALKDEGAPCTGTNLECKTGLYCPFGSTDGVCTRKRSAGEACDDAVRCDDLTTYCGPDKTCTALLTVGAACTTGDACASGQCEGGACKGGPRNGSTVCFH